MIIKELVLRSITETKKEDVEGEGISYMAFFEKKEKGIRVSISQADNLKGISVGFKYDIEIKNKQKTIDESLNDNKEDG